MSEKITIEGRLGADPVVRITQAGKQVCNLSIAVNKRIPCGNGFEDSVTWHRCVLWQGLAEQAQPLRKGQPVCVAGFQKRRTWTGRDGKTRTTVEIIAEKVEAIDSLPQSAPSNGSKPTNGGVPRAQIPDDDSDIPF